MKRNKQRRAYLKRFSSEVVNTGGAERLDKYHLRELYGASSMIGTPPTSKLNPYSHTIPVSKMEKPWQADTLQGTDKYNKFLLYDLGFKKLELYFSGTKWFFRKEELDAVQISIIYGSRDEAMLSLNSNRVAWKALKARNAD